MKEKIIDFLNSKSLEYRVLKKDGTTSQWNSWITIPVDGYIDIGIEPILIKEIVSTDVRYKKKKQLGIRLKPFIVDYDIEIIEEINKYNIKYEYLEEDILRIYL